MNAATTRRHGFRLVGIDHAPFEALFEVTDEELRARHAVRRLADSDVAYVHLHNAKQGCLSRLVVRA